MLETDMTCPFCAVGGERSTLFLLNARMDRVWVRSAGVLGPWEMVADLECHHGHRLHVTGPATDKFVDACMRPVRCEEEARVWSPWKGA